MPGYKERDNRNTSLNLMSRRLGVFYRQKPVDVGQRPDKFHGDDYQHEKPKDLQSILDPELIGIDNQKTLLEMNGGALQQERMIFDKRRSLDRAKLYSYQGALVKKLNKIKNIDADDEEEEDYRPERGLINPNKNKMDYDDKILSIEYEYGLGVGDVFEWLGTKTYWLIYLQDITELAYFRGDIRRCSYEIAWEDENGRHSTYAAVRGPVETKINYIQKHQISMDEPNHSLHILLPRTKETLEYFRRYSKFYLQGEDPGSPKVCWRVEATDWISTPGILEITAVEYYINTTEDDVDDGIVGGLIARDLNPNDANIESTVVGETFIKPQITYSYHYEGPKLPTNTKWKLDKKYPIEIKVDPSDRTKLTLKWLSNYSGQLTLSYGEYTKTIIVESLY